MAQAAKNKQKAGDGSTLTSVLDKKKEKIDFEVVEEESLPGSRMRFKLRMTEEAIKPRLENTYKEFNRYVRLPGFRPGKAPKALLRNRYEKDVREEMVKRMTERLAEIYAEDKGIEPLTQPVLLEWSSSAQDGTVVELAFEIRPKVEIKEDNLQGLKAEIHRIPVDDAFVERELERLRKEAATFEPTEDGYQPGDGMLLNCEVTTPQGDPVHERSREEYYTTNVEEEMPDDVAKALVGKKKDETVELEVVEESERQPGTTDNVRYWVKVLEVKRRILPELDDDFAKDVGEEYETLEDLRRATREKAEKAEENRQREEALERVYEQLRERIDIDIPRALVEHQTQHSVSQMEHRLNQVGLSLKQMDRELLKNYVEGARAQASLNVRNGLILRALGDLLNVEVQEEHINEALQRAADQTGRKPLAIRAQLEAKKEWERFVEDLKLKVTNDRLLEKVTISHKEVTAEEYEQEMQRRQAEKAAELEGRNAGAGPSGPESAPGSDTPAGEDR